MCIDKCFQRECCTASFWVEESLECLGYVSFYLGEEVGNEALTIYCKANEEDHAGLQRNYVH